jgi:hypothetical protein
VARPAPDNTLLDDTYLFDTQSCAFPRIESDHVSNLAAAGRRYLIRPEMFVRKSLVLCLFLSRGLVRTNVGRGSMKDMNATNRIVRAVASAIVLLFVAVGAWAQDATQAATNDKSYPQHGQVIAAHLGISNTTGNGFAVASLRKWVYRVDCGELYYEIEGGNKLSFTIGQGIDFRMEEEKAYLKGDKDKETKYRVVGMGKSDARQKP